MVNHPANALLSDERILRICYLLEKAANQSDGGNLGYAMSDAVKGLEELRARRIAAEPLVGIDMESAVGRLAEKRDRTQGAMSPCEQNAYYDGFRDGAEAGLSAAFKELNVGKPCRSV